MNAQSFTPKVYLKDGCPFSFKFWLFMVEARLGDRIEVIRCNPNDPRFEAVKEKLAKGLGKQASFPTAEIAPDRYLSDSDSLIEHFATEQGANANELPALAFYEESILPQVVKLHEQETAAS